ncbi:hypothetical protein [Kitasatospora sp. A2-31]|uniref:hypothetical protein n=1 Tax=Kitasatospora sp. A2-31 TaxID=2916414 RepID=UPI001EEB82B5|nr:hypothetical protein [Kitasatospora sp. A2-31]MCG6498525.1 hypothetical protein [Kitasatospora sp. A2-31]
MAGTGIRGAGSRTADTVGAWVFGAMTAVIDGLALAALCRGHASEVPAQQRAGVDLTLGLLAVSLFGSLLGAALAGKRSTPQRRWRFAMTGALTAHLLIPAAWAIAIMIDPPTFVW